MLLCIIVQYISETSAIQTCSHEQSPDFGAALVWTHGPRTRQFAFAINAYNSSRFSIILQSGVHEHATIDRPPPVILHFDFVVELVENPRICRIDMNRNIAMLKYFIIIIIEMYLYSFSKQKKLVVFFCFCFGFYCTRFQRDKSIAHLRAAVPYSIVENVLGSIAAHQHVSAASVHNIIGPFANVLVPSDEMRIVFGG